MANEHPQVLSASTMIGDKVENLAGERLGEVKELMIDIRSGDVVYAVLSFGGFMGVGDKLFAIPWPTLRLDTERKSFQLDINKERLKDAPGFDKDHWPSHADSAFIDQVYSYYRVEPRYRAQPR